MFKISNYAKTTIFGRFSVVSLQSKPVSTAPVPTHQHIAHLILEQKSASQALQTFRWASNLPDFIHNQSTYRALIHKLCSFRRFETVKEVLDEMPDSIGSPPDESIFVTIVRGLGRARMIKQVIKVLDLITKFEMNPSLKIFNSILDVLVKEDIDLAREFYRKKMMNNGVSGDDYTFGILMKGLCLTNRIGDAFKLLQVMKSGGKTPNTVIYNTMIHALCKNGKVGRARSLMNEMGEPSDVTFNVLISAYCQEDNLVQALVLLEKSFSMEFVPDVVSATKVVGILCKEGRVTEAVEVLERVESRGGLVDAVAYNTLINGFCMLGKPKVGHRVLKDMEMKGILPNVETYNILVSGYCDSGMLDSAVDLFHDMKTDGLSWNFTTYHTLIRGLCSGGRMEDGFKILELMEESKGGAGGRISPYNSILYGFYKKNQFEEAFEFLTKMEKLFPRAVDRSLRILGFCNEGSISDAKRVYDQMIAEGGVPSAIVYVCLIHGLCQEGNVKEAFELINEMVDNGYFPIASTFNALISAFCRQGKVGSGVKLMEDMVGRGFSPDLGSYSPILDALCNKGGFHKAVWLFLQMVEKGILPDYLTWKSMLHGLTQETVWVEGKSLFHASSLLYSILES